MYSALAGTPETPYFAVVDFVNYQVIQLYINCNMHDQYQLQTRHLMHSRPIASLQSRQGFLATQIFMFYLPEIGGGGGGGGGVFAWNRRNNYRCSTLKRQSHMTCMLFYFL